MSTVVCRIAALAAFSVCLGGVLALIGARSSLYMGWLTVAIPGAIAGALSSPLVVATLYRKPLPTSLALVSACTFPVSFVTGYQPDAFAAMFAVGATLWCCCLAIAVLLPARPRNTTNRCRECGYDLTHNRSGRCPECAASIHPSPGTPSLSRIWRVWSQSRAMRLALTVVACVLITGLFSVRAALTVQARAMPTDIPSLTERLAENDMQLRWEAQQALLARGVDPLTDALANENASIRAGAAEALGWLGDPTAVESLIHALDDADRFVRMHSARALGLLGDESGLAALEPLQHDPDPHVRSEAQEAIARLRSSRGDAP